MDYNNKLISLIEKQKELIITNSKYKQYINLLNKINVCLSDFSKITEINENDIELFNDPKAVKYIAGIEYFYRTGNITDINEIKNAINWLKDRILSIIENDKELNEVKDSIIAYDKMIENINKNKYDETILEFIKDCYYKKLIDVETAIKLNLYVAKNSMENIDEQEEITVLEENTTPILEEIKQIFNKYGYDYDTMNLNTKTREKIEKYAKLDYLDYVLSILKENQVSLQDFEDRQGVISNIIIYQDKESLEGIREFIKNNNCRIQDLFEIGNIFHKRKRKFQFKSGNIGGPSPSLESVSGAYESFMKNIELYKKYKNLPEDYKISKDDFTDRTLYFITPHEKILENFTILQAYGILNDGEFPEKCSMLCGANVQFLLDRFIEAGLYDYCKKNPSSLELEYKNFRWYKIKRAIDLNENLERGRGLRKELKDDSSLYGISYVTEGTQMLILQEQMTIEQMEMCLKKLPYFIREKIYPEKVLGTTFNMCYRYGTYDIEDIFRTTELSKAKLARIKGTVNQKDKISPDFSEIENDYYIRMLDNAVVSDQDNNQFNCKVDDKTYMITNKYYPGVKVLISRYKVLNIVRKLKENNLWIDTKNNNVDIENYLLVALLNETILSEIETHAVRLTIRTILNNELTKNNTEGKGRK